MRPIGPAVRAIPRASVLAAAIAFLLACGGGGVDSPTGPGTPSTPTGPTVTASLGPDVPSQTVANVASFVTLGDSVAAHNGVTQRAMAVAVDSGSVPTLALNSAGDPLAAAFGTVNSAASLTPSSTALVLVRVLIPSAEIQVPDEQTLRLAITQRPEFAPLTDSVRATMSRGVTYASAPGVLAQASLVVKGILATLPPATPLPSSSRNVTRADLAPPTGAHATIAVGPPVFKHYPVTLKASGGIIGIITFANSSFSPFSVNVSPQPGTNDELDGETFCPLCLPPSFGTLPVKKGYPATSIAGGLFTATVALGTTQRQAIVTQFAVDLFVGILRVAAINAPEDQLKPALEAAITSVDIHVAVAQGSWSDAANTIAKSISTASLPALVRSIGAATVVGTTKAGATTFLRALALPLAYIDTGLWAAGRLAVYADAATYWNTAPETVPFCFAAGTMYNACAASVSVSLSSSTVTVRGTVQATAFVKDAAGDTLSGLPVQWSITSGPATVDQNGTVTATGAGTITVTGRVLGTSGIADLTAQL
jgi:hypothetical protein